MRIFWRSSLILNIVNRRVLPSARNGLSRMPIGLPCPGPYGTILSIKQSRNRGNPIWCQARGRVFEPAGSESHAPSRGSLGFILFRFGFFRGGMISVVPPFAVIFSAADFEK